MSDDKQAEAKDDKEIKDEELDQVSGGTGRTQNTEFTRKGPNTQFGNKGPNTELTR